MKILYDYQTFFNQDFGGISRYFFELLNSFTGNDTFEFELPIEYSNNIYLKTSSEFKNNLKSKIVTVDAYQSFLKGFDFIGKRKLFNLKQKVLKPLQPINDLEVNRKLSIEKLKRGDYDIFHPTYYDNYFLEFLENKPYVITVYDMIHQIFPEYFLWGGIDKSKELLQNANKIIAISESTKKDLVGILGIEEKKVEVTYLANSLSPVVQDSSDFVDQLPKKYLLFVGNRDGYKNFYFFIQAYTVILKEFNDLYVVCTGKPFEPHELNYFDKLGIKDRIRIYYIDDIKLAILYQHASAFIFPSMYEGFGIPILEAFVCGCPVITSNAGSLPEVGGNSVLYFEPKNIGSLISALRKLLYDSDVRSELIKNGFEQVEKFSWEKTAIDTKNIYKNVLSNN